MTILDSYLRDLNDLIKILLNIPWSEGLPFLTMDVSALYYNIDHELGVNCVNNVLLQNKEILESRRLFLTKALKFILENNFFTFGEDIFWKRKRNRHGHQNGDLLHQYFYGCVREKIPSWKSRNFKDCYIQKFIANLFLLWKGNEQEAMHFVKEINQNNWGITLTPKFYKKKNTFSGSSRRSGRWKFQFHIFNKFAKI